MLERRFNGLSLVGVVTGQHNAQGGGVWIMPSHTDDLESQNKNGSQQNELENKKWACNDFIVFK